MDYLLGQNATLTVQWTAYENGPNVNVTGVSVVIKNATTGASVGGGNATNLAVGVDSFVWSIPVTGVAASYVAVWTGTYGGNTVTASELFTVLDGTQAGISPTNEPCSTWPIVNCNWSQFSDTSASGIAMAAATEILDSMSGRQFAPCPITIRPCAESCWDNGMWFGAPYPWWNWGTWPRPLFFQGTWYNLTCGNCAGGRCSCAFISEAKMPVPVYGIDQVKIDGAVIDPSLYALRDYRYLMRTDGNLWPRCNNLAKDDTATGTWSVQLRVGQDVPELGKLAMGELTCQIMSILTGKDCILPKSVQSMTRQGITLNFLDPTQIFPAGKLGLYLSDLFIETFNPHQLMSRTKFYDLDGSNYSIRTGF